MTGPNESYIFFLRYDSQLTEDYIYMAQELKEWGITLVPVRPEELPGLANGGRQFVIGLHKNLNSARQFEKFRKKYFDFSIKETDML